MQHPVAGLMAMRSALHSEVERTRAVLYEGRVHSISEASGKCLLRLESGELVK
ncbi:hypothetical protein DFQ28_003386, partial [Apophysomyces sp. BC1034]